MATATYTSDISTAINNAESGTWLEMTGWAQGGGPGAEADYFIQGSGAQSQLVTKSGLSSAAFNNGSAISAIPADGAFTAWINVVCANLLDTDANGGLRLVMGSGAGAFKGWNLGGKDSYVYGGWVNIAVNPAINGGSADYTVGGGGTTSYQYVGGAIQLSTGASRGNYFNVDALRGGRCEARFAGGTSPDAACSFSGFAATNDNTSNRWGLIQAVGGGYLWKGLMTLGYGAACRFTDSNTQVLVDRTPKVTSAFNKIEIRNASTEINWTSISFLTLTGGGSIANTASKGSLEVVDDCDVNITGCTFTGMDTFIFKATSSVLTSVFRNCGVITAGGANFAGTKFEGYAGTADTSYLNWNTSGDPGSKLANCTFTKGSATAHALSFTDTTLTDINLPNTLTFDGYNAANNQNDSAVYFAKSDGSITVHYDGTMTYKSAGATINKVASQIDVTLTGLKDNTEVRVYAQGTTTALAGVENATDGTQDNRSYTFTLAAATDVDIRIFCLGYLPADILDYTVPTANASIPVQQVYDRVYENIFALPLDRPTITDVDPDPSYGGQQVTITGTNFDIGEIDVYFGVDQASNVTVINSTSLTCIIPSHDNGLVEVEIVNDDGISDGYWFTYSAPGGGKSLPPIRRTRYGALIQM